ncbi:MAG: glycosyltransferase [Phycisphaeraceae bacterium]
MPSNRPDNAALRVCHFSGSRGLGHGEVYVDLANQTVQDHPGVEVGLLVPADAKFLGRVDPRVTILAYKSKDTRNNPRLWFELVRLLRRYKPDVVHTHFAKATEVYRRIAPLVRVPYVATKHNPRKGRVFEKVPRVIAVAEVVRQSIGHDRVTVIHNGITPRDIDKPTRHNDGVRRFLSVGRLDPIKGYDHLIRALAQHDRPWSLTLLGEGPQRAELEALAQSLGVADRVAMPGFSNRVPEAMAGCDVFVISSHSEGCSVALLEAMAYAPLAISTPVGLAPELFPSWLVWDAQDPSTLDPFFGDYDALAQRYTAWIDQTLPRFYLSETTRQHVAYYRDMLGRA